jgi:hypothetical protein
MSVLKDARQKTGYDIEELWFHERERELIAKIKHREWHLKLVQGGRAQQGDESRSSNEVEDPKWSKAA